MKFFREFLNRIKVERIEEYAARCAYFTFLSFIPFIILLLSLIKYMNIEKDTLTYLFSELLPEIAKSNVLDIIQETYSKSFQTISISLIFTLWSASKSFYSLNVGLFSIYKRKDEGNYIILRLRGIVGTIFILISIIIALFTLIFGNNINKVIEENFIHFSSFSIILISMRKLLIIIALFIAFLILYRLSAGKKYKGIRKHIIGALFSTICLFAITYFFSVYVDIFTNFSIIYGSLATITLILMWLYAIIYIIFVGAMINVMIEENKKIGH